MSILEQEIVDVKNQKQQRVGKLMMTQDQSDKFELLVEELNQLWSFVQRFIDEQAVDMVQEVRSVDKSYKDKMNRMDWLARNAEFLSPDSITKCLLAFKELYTTDNVGSKNAYININHTSMAIFTVIHLIEHTKLLERDEETTSRLAILISILEPLLVNEMNLEKALQTNIIEILLSILYLPESFK
mmetsp:Transcript_2290/g.2235  ORF Transcript_2290/g.2235 Transcript_2290/m.2235 type:complete len:186 (+) Transcript_2290:754-1311(+)